MPSGDYHLFPMRKPLLLLVQDTPSVKLTVVLVRFTRTGLLLIDKGIDLSPGEFILLSRKASGEAFDWEPHERDPGRVVK
jgi:hypothetical protein